jgi:hypothetical protein
VVAFRERLGKRDAELGALQAVQVVLPNRVVQTAGAEVDQKTLDILKVKRRWGLWGEREGRGASGGRRG